MDHDGWLELISADVDGELDAGEHEQLSAHLGGCTSCQELHERFSSARRRARFRTTAPRDLLLDDVLAARAEEQAETVQVRRRLVRRAAVAGIAVAAAAAAVALIPFRSLPAPTDQAGGPATALIAARNRSFDRADIEIAAGTRVEWRNSGTTTHHLVRQLGAATVDEDLPPGRTETATFEQPGRFPYYCTIRPAAAVLRWHPVSLRPN